MILVFIEGNRQDAVSVVADGFVLSFMNETGRTHTPIPKDDEEATKVFAKAVSRRMENRRSRVEDVQVEVLVTQSDTYKHFGHFEPYEHR